jgi:hypothetical protein
LLRSAEANPLFYRFVSKYDFVILRDYLRCVTGGQEMDESLGWFCY